MSIHIRVYLKPTIVEHPSYTTRICAESSVSGHTESKYGLIREHGALERIHLVKAENELVVECRLPEGARFMPDWIPREHIDLVRLTSSFNCAKMRLAGRYRHNGEYGQADGTLHRKAPELKALEAAKIDGSFVHAMLLLVENVVTLKGDHGVFSLYYLIRRGDILPYEDWDREQEDRTTKR